MQPGELFVSLPGIRMSDFPSAFGGPGSFAAGRMSSPCFRSYYRKTSSHLKDGSMHMSFTAIAVEDMPMTIPLYW